MSTVTVEREVDASVAKVWEVLSDFGGIYRIHPYVDRSPLLTEQLQGVGTERVCHFHDGNHVKERVTEWTPGESMTIEIVEGSMPLKRATANIRLEPAHEGTRVYFTMDYDPKWGLMGKVMDAMMMRAQFRKILDQVLVGLETHIHTGAVVGKDGQPLPAEAVA